MHPKCPPTVILTESLHANAASLSKTLVCVQPLHVQPGSARVSLEKGRQSLQGKRVSTDKKSEIALEGWDEKGKAPEDEVQVRAAAPLQCVWVLVRACLCMRVPECV